MICEKCRRWNLTPIEERWEAIEDCERRYRATVLRVSTEHIGLSRLTEGLELVRIGKPQRPELAAWRYGDKMGWRRAGAVVRAVVSVAGFTLINPIQGAAMLVAGLEKGTILGVGDVGLVLSAPKVITRLTSPDGGEIRIRNRYVDEIAFLSPTLSEPWGLRIKHGAPRHGRRLRELLDPRDHTTEIRGEPAMRVATAVLPRINRFGATSSQVTESVGLLEEAPDAEILFTRAARMFGKRSFGSEDAGLLSEMPIHHRLALEMISHEDIERRALEGELYLLEDAWREAEEIATIADNMFMPPHLLARFAAMKRRFSRS